ncbi:MAG: hypothetical protein Q4C42_11740, partial [Clostridia bacterium]|nr:hypothetical protein [Clostridia bacterium]
IESLTFESYDDFSYVVITKRASCFNLGLPENFRLGKNIIWGPAVIIKAVEDRFVNLSKLECNGVASYLEILGRKYND